MNFAIFDEDFVYDKPNYIKELEELEKDAIDSEHRAEWKQFAKQHLTDTRNFYLLKTSLKIMQNLKNNLDFDSAVFSSLSFMPDQTFIETSIMLVARFSNFGKGLANHFNVDISEILKAKIEAKKQEEIKKQKESLKKKNNTQNKEDDKEKKLSKPKEATFGKQFNESKLISSMSVKIGNVDGHLKNISNKKRK